MTAFEDLERGDIIWASDPLSEKGRPMLILGAPQLPNHGTQLITVLLSTKTYHEEALPLRDDDYDGDPLGKRSHGRSTDCGTSRPRTVDGDRSQERCERERAREGVNSLGRRFLKES